MLGRPLLFPDLVLLPADLVKHALPFADDPNLEVRNRLIADVMEQFYPYYSFLREELRKGTRQPPGGTVVEASPADHLSLPGKGDRAELEPSLAERDRVEWIRDWPDLVELSTTTSAPALLVLRDTYYRGWRAAVDGVEVPIWRTDYLFRGVEVPAGEHTVRFEFRPLSFRIGLVISVLAWLVGLGLFVVKRIN